MGLCLLAATAFGDDHLELSAGYSYTNNTVFNGNLIVARNQPFVDVDGEWHTWYLNLQQGLGYNVWQHGPWHVGLGLNYLAGRREGDDPRLHGMGNVSDGALLASVIKWEPIKDGASITTSVFRQTGTNRPAYITTEAFIGIPGTAKLNGFIDINGNWGNAAYNQRLYGVDSVQAAHSGYSPYAPPSGWNTLTAVIGISFEPCHHWQWIAAAGVSQFAGPIAASPLIAHTQQPTAYLFGTYRF